MFIENDWCLLPIRRCDNAYVGSSRNVEKRIREHRQGDLDFAGYFVDECAPSQLRDLEARAIAAYDPPFNVLCRPPAGGGRFPSWPRDSIDSTCQRKIHI